MNIASLIQKCAEQKYSVRSILRYFASLASMIDKFTSGLCHVSALDVKHVLLKFLQPHNSHGPLHLKKMVSLELLP